MDQASATGGVLSLPGRVGAFSFIYYTAASALSLAVPVGDIYSVMPIIDVVTMPPVTLSGLGLREKLFAARLVDRCGLPTGGAVLISLTGFGRYCCWSRLGESFHLFFQARLVQEVAVA